jgi:hypothetical protein
MMFTFFHIILIFFSYFWAPDPDPGPKSHIFVIFLVIFVSYYFQISVKPSFPACPYGQSLQRQTAFHAISLKKQQNPVI